MQSYLNRIFQCREKNREMATILSFGLFLILSKVNSFIGDWQSFQNGYSTDHCFRIPNNLTLCRNVGYNRMVLPNFIQHEYMEETVQHSKVWLGLVNSLCHDDIRKFLCSLYAPVCINNQRIQKVPPCRELCISVKEACLPSMKLFGFEWPTIMKCSKFPEVRNSLCIPTTNNKEKKCGQCLKNAPYEVMANRFCLSPIVIRAKIKRIAPDGNSGYKIFLNKKSKFFKFESNSTQNSISLSLKCNCNNIKFKNKALKGRWLIMGRIVDNETVVNFITKWRRKKADFRKNINIIKKLGNNICKLKLSDGSYGQTPVLKRYLEYTKMKNMTRFQNTVKKVRKNRKRKHSTLKPNQNKNLK